MSRLGSYWLIFVIVAVGLALSWGQVGRKTERVLRSEPVVYLVNESPCQPMIAPCAALGSDRALVVGPATGGLILKQTGLELEALVDAEAIFLDARDREIGRHPLPLDGRIWLVAEIPRPVRTLRVRLSSNREITVGEFPLR